MLSVTDFTPLKRRNVKKTPLNKPLSEHAGQRALFDWSAHIPQLKTLHAIPNAAKRGYALANYLKQEGLRKGYPDVSLDYPVAPYHGARIEMKSARGKLSPEQDWWLTELKKNGYACCVAYSFEEARDFLIAYLAGKV